MPTINQAPQVGAGETTPKNDNAPDRGDGGGAEKTKLTTGLNFTGLLCAAVNISPNLTAAGMVLLLVVWLVKRVVEVLQ